jgi:hypothetical protein
MINEDHGAEAECHFCRNKYQFSEEELQQLLDNIKYDIPPQHHDPHLSYFEFQLLPNL